MIRPPAPRPCSSCPYRRDVPSGVWAASEYDKLRAFDAPTMHQPPAVFLCHQRGRDDADRVCAGWAGTHDGAHLLALRVAAVEGQMSPEDVDATIDYVSPVPLFGSGAEAAVHGQAEIAVPGERAVETMAKIARVRTDLITEEEQVADQHPLPVGTRVRHSGQRWPRAFREGTGEIIDVKGPYRDGAYEYLIKHDRGFSGVGPPGEPSWWASYRTERVDTPGGPHGV